MVKTAAIIFGIVFLAVGILGFVPAVTTTVDGMRMFVGIFLLNAFPNYVHIASGIVFLLCGMAGAGPSRTFFKIFGLVYALLAVLGCLNPMGPLFGMTSTNPAVTWLHVVLAAVMLFLGFGPVGRTTATV